MKKVIFVLIMCLSSSLALAKQAELMWDQSDDLNIIKYRVYESMTSGGHVKGQFVQEIPVLDGVHANAFFEITEEGDHFYVITSFNSCEVESDFSEEIKLHYCTTASPPPAGLKAAWVIFVTWVNSLFNISVQWLT